MANKDEYIYMQFVRASLNKREMVSAIASAVVCAVKCVNSFARRQHRFDIRHGKTDRRRFEFSLLSCFLIPVPISPKTC